MGWLKDLINVFLDGALKTPIILPEVEELDVLGPFDGPLSHIPWGKSGVLRVYGDPAVTYTRNGRVKVNRKWERANLHVIPAEMIPGYDRKLYVHRLVSPYFIEAMRRCHVTYPEYEFARIGLKEDVYLININGTLATISSFTAADAWHTVNFDLDGTIDVNKIDILFKADAAQTLHIKSICIYEYVT